MPRDSESTTPDWEFLQHRAASFFPSRPDQLSKEHHVRRRYVPEEPLWNQAVEEFGYDFLWQIINAGSQEILADGEHNNNLYGRIYERVRKLLGIPANELVPGFKPDFIHTRGRPLKYDDMYLLSVLDDVEYASPSDYSIRSALVSAGATLVYNRGLAPPHSAIPAGSGATYMRSSPNRDHVYQQTQAEILAHYDLLTGTKVLITNKGIQTNRLIHDTLLQDLYPRNPNSGLSGINIVTIGSQYYETQNELEETTNNLRHFSTFSECDLDMLFASAKAYREVGLDGRPAFMFRVDPLENAPAARRHDISQILSLLSEKALEHNVDVIVVTDDTLMAGTSNIKEHAAHIKPGSRTVLISQESLLKYLSLGNDLDYLGSVTITGNEELSQEIWSRMTRRYRQYALAPSRFQLGSFPPISSEYLRHRASRISRNAAILTQELTRRFPALKLTYSGQSQEVQSLAAQENSGFCGGLFFIETASPEAAKALISALTQHIPQGRWGSIDQRDGFGYSQTTVSEFGNHVRVSVGSEDMFLTFFQLLNLAQVLAQTQSYS